MKYAGPVAGKLGISLEQAAAMAGVLANMGIRGVMPDGNACQPGSSGITAKGAAEALKELGVAFWTRTAKCARWRMCWPTFIKLPANTGKLTGYPSLRTSPGRGFHIVYGLVDAAVTVLTQTEKRT
ncbi:phage tail tape measure protein [Escherichia coli]|uniref:phage tail tape measure protein n=1 Tax=Escherichia coli TaxID=562 RepID=UPI0024C4A630|nr:phage tail tape measure protein [Escherichia coli]